MGNLRACFAVALLALAACGSDSAKVDAGIKLIDAAMPDSKVWNDAPPGPDYDFTCFNGTPPTTAPANINVTGSTQSFSMSGSDPVDAAVVDVFKNSDTTTSLANDTSDATGAFELMNIATGGTPIEGYIRASKAAFRTTYMYPPSAVNADLTGVPVIMFANAFFDAVAAQLGGQDDATSGVMLFAVTDCDNTMQTLIGDASVTVEQGGTMVGTMIGLGLVDPSLDGTYLVTNVPDGETQIKATYDGMAFPVRTVRVYKKPMGQNAEGTLTFTAVRPGP
jgi:hypothetical protein